MARKALLITLALILALAVPALAQKKSGDKSATPLASSPSVAAKGHGEVHQFRPALGRDERQGAGILPGGALPRLFASCA